MLLAIDPGTTHSGRVLLARGRVLIAGDIENGNLADGLSFPSERLGDVSHVVCEWIEHYGRDIHPGMETFHTCRWIGRFQQAWGDDTTFHLMTRRQVKQHLCGSAKAKDSDIRTALIDKHGGRVAAIGKKSEPGPLYGVSGHSWSALALAVTFTETLGGSQ